MLAFDTDATTPAGLIFKLLTDPFAPYPVCLIEPFILTGLIKNPRDPSALPKSNVILIS